MHISPSLRPTVVVVEDDVGLLASIEYALEAEGFLVIGCRGGEDLLDLNLPTRPLYLVVDYHLGGMNGAQLIDTLAMRDGPRPTIMITTAPSKALMTWAKSADVQVVAKPLLHNLLVSTLQGFG